jgi:hypothetical protein
VKVIGSRFVLLCVVLLPLWGQVNKSNLTGVIHDASGSAAPNVALRLTNIGTGAVRQEVTDASGLYRFTLIDFGQYRLEAEAPGFHKFIREGIALETGQTTTVDITLEVGTQTESVTVTAESPLLRTETGSLGTSVNTRAIEELPLKGRNPYMFLQLSSGIQYFGDPGAINPWDNFGPSNFTSNGSKAGSEFLLDGIPNMRLDIVSFSPSPDAVQEMRAETNAFDAEYGHSGSAFVNVSTKSGTNEVHGSSYWYLQNSDLNANSFFNNRNRIDKTQSKQNTYGAAVGGPVWLPKIYNGKDKTFYFFDFEGTQIRSAGVSLAQVPSLLQRDGNFSQTTDVSGRPITIYDPTTTRQVGAGYVRDPFPGNTIPKSAMDPVALKSLAFYPLPNRPVAPDLSNFQTPTPSGRQWASLVARGDHQINSNNAMFFRFGWNHRTDPSDPYYGACCKAAGNPTTGQDVFVRGNIAAGTGYTWIASTRTVVDFRMGMTRYYEANVMFGEGFDLSSLGFPAAFAKTTAFATFPRFDMNNDLQNLGAGRTSTRLFINQYNPLVNVHTSLGRHAFKYGFRYQVGQQIQFNPVRSGGYYLFGRALTQGPNPTVTSTTAGYALAGFLLGTPTQGYADYNVQPTLSNRFFSLYFQDDWKVTDRLTLNLGIRAEHEGPVTDRYDHGNSGFDFGVASPLAAQVAANYAAHPVPQLAALNLRGGIGFVGAGGAPDGNLSMPAVDWAPRLGFAYRINSFAVVRGGYGIFYVPNVVSNYQQTGFSLQTQMVNSLDNNLTPYDHLADPFPSGVTLPTGSSLGLLTGIGKSITIGGAPIGQATPFLAGLSQQFSLGIEFALPGQVALDVSYVGNNSQRLNIFNGSATTNGRNVDQYPDQYLALGAGLNAQVTNPFYGVITDPTTSLSQKTIALSQLLRPYPQFTGITETPLPTGRSHYDSFQFQANKRMAHGFSYGVSYNFSKYMEAVAYLNANDAGPANAISSADRHHRLVLNGIYELPFGRGKPFLNSRRLLRDLVGGWQTQWVVTLQSGAPLAFMAGTAVRVNKSASDPKTVDRWFDISQFAPEAPFTLNTLSIQLNDLRAPGINKWDLTAMKKIRITERVEFRLQGEFYNAFNKALFDVPNTTVTSPNFGRITAVVIPPRQIQLSGRLTW